MRKNFYSFKSEKTESDLYKTLELGKFANLVAFLSFLIILAKEIHYWKYLIKNNYYKNSHLVIKYDKHNNP
jgi:hypothetical protein